MGKPPSGRILLNACCFPVTHFRTTAVWKRGFRSSPPMHSAGQRHCWKSAHVVLWDQARRLQAPPTALKTAMTSKATQQRVSGTVCHRGMERTKALSTLKPHCASGSSLLGAETFFSFTQDVVLLLANVQNIKTLAKEIFH